MAKTGDSGRELYFARWPLGYGQDPNGHRPQVLRLARGQAFELDERQPEGNERLIRLGYIQPVEAGTDLSKCDECGAEFIAPGYRDGHVRAAHATKTNRRRKPVDAAAEEKEQERQERQLMREAPLYLEKRVAAQTA